MTEDGAIDGARAATDQACARGSHRIATPDSFLYFAYGSCMCPVDLKRTLKERTHQYVLGPATLMDYGLGFYKRSPFRHCGVLDLVPRPGHSVEGVLYRLPWRLSALLDDREEVPTGGYRHEQVTVDCNGQSLQARTYVVVDKLPEEIPPNDWYFNVVMRGAITCGLSEDYCWQLFDHMRQLQEVAFQ
jgi:cation transport regulator ChaC